MASAPDSDPTSAPAQRAILLGASNLVRSMPAVLEAVHLSRGGPLEVFLACGHGRSYGATSRILGRALPGIVHCGLWEALAERPPLETTALVTDIGNDLLYGSSPAVIAGWVETCLDRLQSLGARPVITALPLGNLTALSAARYKFFRTLFFPPCKLSLSQMREAAHQLDERIRQFARLRQVPIMELRSDWYGLDPIHIRYRHAPTAWHEILSHWSEQQVPQGGRMSWRTWLALHRLKPAERIFLGREQRSEQPALRRPDGTTLWLY
jgi:hypothetical protein